jgi:hypothetical protein
MTAFVSHAFYSFAFAFSGHTSHSEQHDVTHEMSQSNFRLFLACRTTFSHHKSRAVVKSRKTALLHLLVSRPHLASHAHHICLTPVLVTKALHSRRSQQFIQIYPSLAAADFIFPFLADFYSLALFHNSFVQCVRTFCEVPARILRLFLASKLGSLSFL